MLVALLTGLVFKDISRTLYSGVAIFISGRVMDAVVYSFDYSRVALIISKHHETIAAAIAKDLDRGATYLHAEGSYSRADTKVVLTAVKRQHDMSIRILYCFIRLPLSESRKEVCAASDSFNAPEAIHIDESIFTENDPCFIIDRSCLHIDQIAVLISNIIELTDQCFRQGKTCNDL